MLDDKWSICWYFFFETYEDEFTVVPKEETGNFSRDDAKSANDQQRPSGRFCFCVHLRNYWLPVGSSSFNILHILDIMLGGCRSPVQMRHRYGVSTYCPVSSATSLASHADVLLSSIRRFFASMPNAQSYFRSIGYHHLFIVKS